MGKQDMRTMRYGVQFAEGDPIAIKREHLTFQIHDPFSMPPADVLLAQMEESSSQQGIAETLPIPPAQGAASQDAASVNAQLSNALLQQHHAPGTHLKVVLMRFSRSPQTFRKALLEAPELADWRHALESQGHTVELNSGAKVFVKPEHYRAVLEEIRLK